MGVFDTLRCEYELPDKEVQSEVFQTKSIRRLMDTYTITREGKLLLHRAWGDRDAPVTDLEIPYDGEIRFYTVLKRGDEYKTYEYRARFTRGRLESLSRSVEHGND
jgi:hypothetical protein